MTQQEAARVAVRKARAAGILRAEPCVVCRAWPTVAHHEHGYDEEHMLDVVWLCGKCHDKVHGRASLRVQEGPLREMRQDHGYSIRDMETRSGINRGRISILERGVTPQPYELARLAIACMDSEDMAKIKAALQGGRVK